MNQPISQRPETTSAEQKRLGSGNGGRLLLSLRIVLLGSKRLLCNGYCGDIIYGKSFGTRTKTAGYLNSVVVPDGPPTSGRIGAAEICGVDFSPAQIELAKAQTRLNGFTGQVDFKCVDVSNDLEFDERFDCVLVHGVFHHLDKSQICRTLETIPRLLKPNGVLIVLEPVWHTPGAAFTLGARWQAPP